MKLIGLILTGVGLPFLLMGGILTYQEINFLHTAVETAGTVKEIASYTGSKSGKQYYPVVEFRSEDGRLYTFKSNHSAAEPEYQIGQTVTVYYNPAEPAEAQIEGMTELLLMGLIFGGIGLIFCSIGGIVIILYIRRLREIEWLKQNGTAVEAEFDSVFYDTSYKVNNKSPYRIRCRWINPYNSETMIFKSEYIWFDPEKYITSKTLRVFIDPGNPKKYYVDTSFLPTIK